MPNICENTIEIEGQLKDIETLLQECSTMGYEGRFSQENTQKVYDLTLAKPMPSEFHTIATGSNTINGDTVDKWEYQNTETGEIVVNSLEAMQDEKTVAVAVPEERLERLRKVYGFDNWYDWAYANWSTKWITSVAVDNVEVDSWTEDNIEMARYTFVIDSAWGPPYELLEFIANEYNLDIHDRWWEEGGEAGWIHIVDRVLEEE